MFKIFRTFLLILFLVSTTTAVYSETNWITKKKEKISFCVQKSKKSSFGYAVTKLNDKSICEGKDFVVTKETNNNLYSFLLTKHNVNSGVFFVKESVLSNYKVTKNNTKLVKKEKKKKEKKKKWIAKKKENKKKLKEKIKESKSWITKKSKEKLNEIKKNLKKHRSIDNLPKAELYFAAMIEPSEDQEALYLYGYINSNKKSDKSNEFKFNNTSYYSLNDGIVYFDDGKTSCQADAKKGVLFGNLKGEIIITCNKKEVIGASIDFVKNGKSGDGNGEYTNGSKVEFEFYTKKKRSYC